MPIVSTLQRLRPHINRFRPGYERLRPGIERLKPWLPALAFASGVASFVLVNRQDALAGWIAGAILTAWMLLLAQASLQRLFTKLSGRSFPPVLGHFALQFVHQETFFFVLPFFFFATTWDTGQAVFMGMLGLAGFVAVWDPWYFRLAKVSWLYMLYHGLSIFVVILTALPIMFELTTRQSYAFTVAAMVIVSLLTLPQIAKKLPAERRNFWWAPFVLVPAIVAGAWWVRFWVPPATLRLNQIAITNQIFTDNKVPGDPIDVVAHTVLHRQGLYAYTAIKAPRGLRETVFHDWILDGKLVDRIPLKISGGREGGYRAWTHKRGFPADARGAWQVQVHTDSGQLIGVLRFRVE
jgi:hypothetical protein